MRQMKDNKSSTPFIHRKKIHLEPGNEPLVSPIYRAAKFTNKSLKAIEDGFPHGNQFLYSRIANPTQKELEINLAAIQGCEAGAVFASGMGAISTALMAHLKSGDEIIVFTQSYVSARQFAVNVLPDYGIKSHVIDIWDKESLEKAMARPQTKLILFESPTNPMVQLVDIQNIVNLARKHQVMTVLDNTFAGIDAHKDFDIDLYIHSLTKYVSGHSDALGGAVLGSEKLLSPIRNLSIFFGATPDPMACYLLSRGLDTYRLRRDKAVENTQAIAEWLEGHKDIAKVYYPGLKSSPDYELACQQEDDFGTVIAMNFVNENRDVYKFCDSLQLFKTSASLGSTKSLVAPVKLFYTRSLTPEQIKQCEINGSTLRLSIGVEDVGDLIADLENAILNS